ncbi:zinc finger MYM-type protein 1-like [Pistacia vera]|uniref:zinc finger MYM-type protein 1-like n=1 Tax=Pistacia vera TaxID=55513 RepID=UPI00126382A5|nr:zinc finger MYM-type protein 1-like [Pistacia vera]
MTAPNIQRELISVCAHLTTKKITAKIVRDKQPFSLPVDESCDATVKEQMAIVFRYVDKIGCVIERFIGVVHVKNTSAKYLKIAIYAFFVKHGLSLTSLRGQGYNGASNMRGEFNGLKTLILRENKSAFYIHCFSHQLQLALVKVISNHSALGEFFQSLYKLSNTIAASCKHRDLLRDKQYENVISLISNGDLHMGRGLNQEYTIKRPGDTRWGSHIGTIHSVINLFSSVVDVLMVIEIEGDDWQNKSQARSLLRIMENFEFVFLLFLMKRVLGITNELSQVLQRKDQDLLNAIQFLRISKRRLHKMRNEDTCFDILLKEASDMCKDNDIQILENMEDNFGSTKQRITPITNKHHFKVKLMYTVLDNIQEELNNRFDEINMRLLQCMASLDPSNSFVAFNKERLLEFAKFYPTDFPQHNIWLLDDQLENYYEDVSTNANFTHVEGIADLAKKMVEFKKDVAYNKVFLLIKLALVLPVATATIERVFSVMNLVKNSLRVDTPVLDFMGQLPEHLQPMVYTLLECQLVVAFEEFVASQPVDLMATAL